MYEIEHILLALTPMERWSATRQLHTEAGSLSWFLLGTGALLLVLVFVFVIVSIKQRAGREVLPSPEPPERAEPPRRAETATPPAPAAKPAPAGLTTRENQILLGIAMCGGDQDSQDIFTSAEAFDQGARNLLADCVETRTPEEREKLSHDIATLRQKLGFSSAQAEQSPSTYCSSSRDIPVGARLELTSERQTTAIEGRVVRNDILALGLELSERVDSRAGDKWHVCSHFGTSVWEFDTTAVSCRGGRLVLNHCDSVQYANRRGFPRVAMNSPALIALLPFRREDPALPKEVPLGATGPRAERLSAGLPTFAEARVTELAGPGLRIETSLPLEPDDMILLVFALAESGPGDLHRPRRTFAVAGRVKHCQTVPHGISSGIQLSGLNDAEIEELVLATREIASRTGAANMENATPGLMAVT
jgi:hypothetical protein